MAGDFPSSALQSKIREIEKDGQIAKAAGWALFYGDIEECVNCLSRGNERLKLMSTAVAGYHASKMNQLTSSTLTWKKLCNDLSVELDEPYLRAIFAFVANGDWQDVLDEQALPLSDRLGIALRFLNEEDLTRYLKNLHGKLVASGEPEGIILTGLATPAAIDLLQTYVDRTSDVQTAALIVSFVAPKYVADDRVRVWLDEYRQLLNKWKLFPHPSQIRYL